MTMASIRKKVFVCSRHFKLSDYRNPQSTCLNWNAVPSINLTKYDDPQGIDSSCYDVSAPVAASSLSPTILLQEIPVKIELVKKSLDTIRTTSTTTPAVINPQRQEERPKLRKLVQQVDPSPKRPRLTTATPSSIQQSPSPSCVIKQQPQILIEGIDNVDVVDDGELIIILLFHMTPLGDIVHMNFFPLVNHLSVTQMITEYALLKIDRSHV